eukprot:SAG31_NODE_5019_length_2799_cov_2.490000_2_plen_47_part_00
MLLAISTSLTTNSLATTAIMAGCPSAMMAFTMMLCKSEAQSKQSRM